MSRCLIAVACILVTGQVSAQPSAGPHGIVQPAGGFKPRGTLDAYVSIRQPTKAIFAWCDPSAKNPKLSDAYDKKLDLDLDGRITPYDAFKSWALSIGELSGYAVHETDYRNASLRFWVVPPDVVYHHSVRLRSYGTEGVGGVYYAAGPGSADIWISWYNKYTVHWAGPAGGRYIDVSGASPLAHLHLHRFFGYASLLRWGWAPQRIKSSTSSCMGNPYLSMPVRHPADNWPAIWTVGRAGWCQGEQVWFAQSAGPQWVAYWERSLTPGTRARYRAEQPLDIGGAEPFPPPDLGLPGAKAEAKAIPQPRRVIYCCPCYTVCP